jgi:hypothetical protein
MMPRRGFPSNPSRRMQGAEHASKTTVEINSGQLHREVGGYPGQNHRMPMCCAVMRSEMSASDAIPTGASEEAGRFAHEPLQTSPLVMGTIMLKHGLLGC